MSIDSISFKTSSIAPIWRQRLLLLLIVALFVLPLAVAWLLIGHWRPEGHVQHGELLDPARPMDLRLSSLEGKPMDGGVLRGWMLVYVGLAAECDAHCRTGLYDMRQVRLALGKDMDRVKTLLLLDAIPATEFRGWLAAEHSATVVGVADAANRTSLIEAFNQPGRVGEWIYLLDPLGNLLMRYPIDTDPRGLLKDLQRLLKWSKIG